MSEAGEKAAVAVNDVSNAAAALVSPTAAAGAVGERQRRQPPRQKGDSEVAVVSDEENGNADGPASGEAVAAAAAADAAAPEEKEDRVVIDPTKDLWANITLNVRDANQEVAEVSLLVVGGSGSGKSTLLQRVYAAAAAGGRKVRPTTALDYSFARRSDRNVSQVAHFWELAQNRQLNALADIILVAENIHAVVGAVVVDLFSAEVAPQGRGRDRVLDAVAAWDTAVYWLKRIDSRTAEVLKRMEAKGSSTPGKLAARAQRFCGGAGNPDLPRMRLSGVPTVLVVNKVDLLFRDVYVSTGGREKAELLLRAFRFLAHLYGCHLVFTAAAPEADGSDAKGGSGDGAGKWRAIASHLLFQTPLESRMVNFDLERERGAILVTADRDTFAAVGEAPMAASAGSGGARRGVTEEEEGGGAYGTAGDAELERWRAALDEAFPLPARVLEHLAAAQRAGKGAGSGAADFTRQLYDTYAEPAIDAMRRQKDEELEQYRKTARQRAKDSARA